MHLFKSQEYLYISVNRWSYQHAGGFPNSLLLRPLHVFAAATLIWCSLFLFCTRCVPSLSWRLHSCILIPVKSSLLPFNKYPAALLFLISVDCYINLYQTCLLHILLLLNVFGSPYWDQALWNLTIFHFP